VRAFFISILEMKSAYNYEIVFVSDKTLALFKNVQTLDGALMGKSVKEFVSNNQDK
jgi:hypothetical protein